MSGHVRFGFVLFLVVAGLSTPATANAITDFFTPNPAPEAASPPAAPTVPAQDDCLSRPGESTAAGQHWVYRYDGHRKCWFQAAADSALARRAARRHVARRHAAAADDNAPAPRKAKAVEDARDEMVSSAATQPPQVAPSAPAPAETPQQPTPSEPKLTIVRTIPVHLADAAAQVPPAPVPATAGAGQPASSQPASDHPTSAQSAPPQVDVEKLLAEAPAANDEVASRHPATPVTAPAAATDSRGGWTTNWLGLLLMALGCAALLSASLRQVLLAVRFRNTGAELPVVAHGEGDEPSFEAEQIRSASARRDELLRYDPQSVAPLAHAARTRQTEAPGLPAPEAIWEEGIGALAALANPVAPKGYSGSRATAYRQVAAR